jgi:hypothetical protein
MHRILDLVESLLFAFAISWWAWVPGCVVFGAGLGLRARANGPRDGTGRVGWASLALAPVSCLIIGFAFFNARGLFQVSTPTQWIAVILVAHVVSVSIAVARNGRTKASEYLVAAGSVGLAFNVAMASAFMIWPPEI